MGRLSESIRVRLTNDELEFIEMISRKTGLSKSEAVRLAINLFRIILAVEAIDFDRLREAIREAARRALEDAKREGWYEDLVRELGGEPWTSSSASGGSSGGGG
ncbi:MAG: hypothetical protein QXU64_02080 [Thermofilaceae archaeon]